jgi:hemoglobin
MPKHVYFRRGLVNPGALRLKCGMSDHPEGGPERRAALTQDVADRTGIDDAMIEMLVRTFYGRVKEDPLLGPIFLDAVEDWDAHIETLCRFWSSVTLMTGRYSGRPMAVHAPLDIERTHFLRWLKLFEQTANEVCPPEAALLFIDRAGKIAESLRQGLSLHRGRQI